MLNGLLSTATLALWVGADALAVPRPDVQPIVGGAPTTNDEFAAVVAILAGQGLCTGTLVDTNLVLTAGHCLTAVQNATDIRVFYGNQVVSNAAVGASAFGVHPEFCATCKNDIYDYGYVTLDGNLDIEPILPIVEQTEWDDTIASGGAVTLVGFGEDPAVEGLESGIGTKRRVDTEIDKLTPLGFEFFAGGDGEDSCEGDSGGPAFVKVGERWRLAGITSRGSSPCGSGGFYGVPYASLEWVAEETGTNLCPQGCGSCDCLDTAPPPADDGCSVAPGGRPSRAGGAWALLGLMGWAGLRRRRR